jgi:hypothetical protein
VRLLSRPQRSQAARDRVGGSVGRCSSPVRLAWVAVAVAVAQCRWPSSPQRPSSDWGSAKRRSPSNLRPPLPYEECTTCAGEEKTTTTAAQGKTSTHQGGGDERTLLAWECAGASAKKKVHYVQNIGKRKRRREGGRGRWRRSRCCAACEGAGRAAAEAAGRIE